MADYLGVLTEIKGRRKALADEIVELDTVIIGLERLSEKLLLPTAHPVVTTGSLRGKTLPRAILAHMLVKSPQTTRNIIDAMKAGGVPSDVKSFPNQVYNCLHRGSKNGGPYVRDGQQWRLVREEGESRVTTAPTQLAVEEYENNA